MYHYTQQQEPFDIFYISKQVKQIYIVLFHVISRAVKCVCEGEMFVNL